MGGATGLGTATWVGGGGRADGADMGAWALVSASDGGSTHGRPAWARAANGLPSIPTNEAVTSQCPENPAMTRLQIIP